MVHIATSSALVNDSQRVEIQTKDIFNSGMCQPEPMTGSPSTVWIEWSSEPSV